MPVTKNSEIDYYLVEATVRIDPESMLPSSMKLVFQRRIDGLFDRFINCEMGTEDLIKYLSAAPTGTTRSQDLTEAIFLWAIDNNIMTGTVT